MPPRPQTPLLSKEEAADYLGCSTRYINQLISEQRIAVVRITNRPAFLQEDLDAYIASRKTPASA